MLFTYRARDVAGELKSGEISALSQVEASRQLRKEGLLPIQMEEKVEHAGAAVWKNLSRQRIRRSEVAYVLNQLAVLIDSGVPLSTALDSMARQSTNLRLREILQGLQAKVESGDPLSGALAAYPRIFDPVIVNLVRAGEASGTLAKMLERIADQARKDIESRSQVLSALTYPLAMLTMCLGLCIFLLVYVFPKIAPMFVSRGLQLPTPTRILMMISDALRYQGHWIALVVILMVAASIRLIKFPAVRKFIDGLILHLPILGKVISKVTLCRILRTLAATLNAGVPMIESIRLCSSVAKNAHYEEIWQRAAERVSTGQQVHTALENSPLIPGSLLQMIASGEQTGKLGHVLNRVSDYYDREVAMAFKTAMGLMEPILITFMGSIIGFIALAMMLPIFKLGSHVG